MAGDAAPSGALEAARELSQVGLDRTLGLEYDEATTELVRAHLNVDERHLQPFGAVHGGVYAAIAESVASIGALTRARAGGGGEAPVGIENHTSLLRAGEAGAELVAEATLRQAGRRVQTWTVSIRERATGGELAISVLRFIMATGPAPPAAG